LTSPAFRRPTEPLGQATDEISDDLLDSSPEVKTPASGNASQAIPLGAPATPDASAIHGVLEQVRHQMEGAFAKELSRVEDSFSWMVKDLESRVHAAQIQLQAARADHERVRAEYERKAEALRELKRSLESL
jgi:hypothetical protein